jgi:hypothetical protein
LIYAAFLIIPGNLPRPSIVKLPQVLGQAADVSI